MSWYRSGTVTVTNGAAAVTGAGTDFVSNAQLGEAFRGPDGRIYEIAAVVSATQLTLAEPYMGGSGGGQAYAISPTASFARDLALGAAQLLNTFGVIRDGVGQGLFSDGAPTSPAIRFTADQDTGIYRRGTNEIGIATGGILRLVVTDAGHVQIDGVQKSIGYSVAERFVIDGQSIGHYGMTMGCILTGAIDPMTVLSGFGGVVLASGGVERGRIDQSGRLLVGASSSNAFGGAHRIARQIGEGATVLSIDGGVQHTIMAFAVEQAGYSGAATGLLLGRNSATGRSVNAGGTINASGADYAEYMGKAAGCGTIAKGDVCGVDGDGHLTKKWADARSFVIKSTDPSYVGGDSWGQSVGARPEGPGGEPAAPIAPPAAPASEDEADVAAWRAIVAAYPAQQAAFQTAQAAWATAKDAYDTALPAWEAALEAERQKVDRIAFSGQVPVNVAGDFAVGDYLIAAAQGAGIKAVAVPEADITFDQYRRRLGKVWAVRDGRAWVDVQHG